MPDYAVVYIDDDTKTYIALPCVKNWLDEHSAPEISYDLRRSKAMEARQLKYKLDDDCRDTGVLSEPDLSGLLFEKLGILRPIRHWWDMPFRTENGMCNPAEGCVD